MSDTLVTTGWEASRRELAGLPGGRGLNIAHEAVDRHADGPRGDAVAFRVLRRDRGVQELTYRDLRDLSNQFANVLRHFGVGPGERVFSLLGRGAALPITVFGALKNRSVCAPLFSALDPEPIEQRLALGDARVLVTTTSLYERKVESLRAHLPGLEHVLLARDDTSTLPDGTRDLGALLHGASSAFTIPPIDPEDIALLHFTSGTTGTPKGALHAHDAVVAHAATARTALDLRPDDVFWCTADPGGVTGISYGVIAPLVIGATALVDEGEYDSARWYRQLEEQQVRIWYTAPPAIRMLMRAGAGLAEAADLSRLRFVASVGQRLNPEAIGWGVGALGLPIHDNWSQTETGAIMIANVPGGEIRPGSMGRALPGVEATAVVRGEHADTLRTAAPGQVGELALAPGWPSMFRGYLHDDARHRRCFADGWYLTGDLARYDEDGYFWFSGRVDDVVGANAEHLRLR